MKLVLAALAAVLSGCAAVETLHEVKKSAAQCELLNSRLDLIDERQREMIRRLDSIDDRLQDRLATNFVEWKP